MSHPTPKKLTIFLIDGEPTGAKEGDHFRDVTKTFKRFVNGCNSEDFAESK
jgi:hypothetical protein